LEEDELRKVKKYVSQVKIFGKNLQRIRKEKGLSQQELADECDIERSTIARIESGTYGAGLHVIFAIAEALNISVGVLFEDVTNSMTSK
jgi:transcriptional regulator with XRE-family HTH domain